MDELSRLLKACTSARLFTNLKGHHLSAKIPNGYHHVPSFPHQRHGFWMLLGIIQYPQEIKPG